MKKEFLKLSVPNILSNLTVPLVSLVDVGLMGRMPTTEYIVAVGLATIVFNIIYWAFGFLRMGTTGLVAQSFGGNDRVKQQSLLGKSLGLGLAIGFVLILLQSLILSGALAIFDSSSIVESLIGDYFLVRIYAAPATIGLYAITGWLLGMQDAKMALLLALVINVVNGALSYVFVVYTSLLIEGVALGTLVAQYVGFLTAYLIIKLKYPWVLVGLLKSFKSVKGEWVEFFKVNSDLFIRTLFLIVTLSFFKVKATEIGEVVGAANVLLLEFITLSAYGIDGLAYASESISGKYFGTRNKTLFDKSIKVSLIYGLGFGLLVSVIFAFFGRNILELLTDKSNVIEAALVYLPWVVLAPFINSLAFIWDGVYIGAAASGKMKKTIIYSTLFVFIPSFYLFYHYFGNHGIWLALTLFMLARGIFQTIWAKTLFISDKI